MQVSKRQRLQLRITDAGFVVLFLAAIGLGLWLSNEYHRQFDWTQSGRNTLSTASVAVLERLDGPVAITAFASERKELRESIRDLVGRYQRQKPDIRLKFVNPATEPGLTREAGIQFDGELLVEYGKGRETVQRHSEEQLTNALARLGKGKARRVLFLSGHGERNPDSQANHDLSTWTRQLTHRGSKVSRLTLGESKTPLKDADLLVIASPQVNLLPGEVEQIKKYVEGGGNLLWLAEPGPLHGLELLAETLGIEFEPGTIVDPTSQAITGQSATFTVVASYGSHPIVKGFSLMTLYPEAAGLRVEAPEGWKSEVFLDTLPSAWSETGPLRGQIKFDKGKDIGGPLNLGVALSRERENSVQRIAVIGDGDFLSNTYIGNGGNLDLGMNLINWVAHDDAFINIPTRPAADIALNLTPLWASIIGFGFMVGLPLVLIGAGIWIWLRRRKL